MVVEEGGQPVVCGREFQAMVLKGRTDAEGRLFERRLGVDGAIGNQGNELVAGGRQLRVPFREKAFEVVVRSVEHRASIGDVSAQQARQMLARGSQVRIVRGEKLLHVRGSGIDGAAGLFGPRPDDHGGAFRNGHHLRVPVSQHAVEFRDCSFDDLARGRGPAVDHFEQVFAVSGEFGEPRVEQPRKRFVGGIEGGLCCRSPVLQQCGEVVGRAFQFLAALLERLEKVVAGCRKALAGRIGAFAHKRRDPLTGRLEFPIEARAPLRHALVDVVLGGHQAGCQNIAPLCHILSDADRDTLDTADDVRATFVEVVHEFFAGATQSLLDAGDLFSDTARHRARRRGELGRHLLRGSHETIGDLGAVCLDMGRRRSSGLGHRIGDILALGAQSRDGPGTGF